MLKKAKKDIRLFFLKLKKWWNDPKRVEYMGKLKYMYVYKYQDCEAVHFHMIFNRKIHKSMLAEWWNHGFNDLRVIKKGTNEFVIKYLGKYVTKAIDDVKSLNQTDVGVKAYAFSRNCKNPIVVRDIKKLTIQDIIKTSFNATNVFYFKSQRYTNGDTVIIGGICQQLLSFFSCVFNWLFAGDSIMTNWPVLISIFMMVLVFIKEFIGHILFVNLDRKI